MESEENTPTLSSHSRATYDSRWYIRLPCLYFPVPLVSIVQDLCWLAPIGDRWPLVNEQLLRPPPQDSHYNSALISVPGTRPEWSLIPVPAVVPPRVWMCGAGSSDLITGEGVWIGPVPGLVATPAGSIWFHLAPFGSVYTPQAPLNLVPSTRYDLCLDSPAIVLFVRGRSIWNTIGNGSGSFRLVNLEEEKSVKSAGKAEVDVVKWRLPFATVTDSICRDQNRGDGRGL